MKKIIDCEVLIDDLNYDFGNPRKISKENLAKLKKSVEQFGVLRSIGIDEDNNVIFGNQLSQAMRQLGIGIPIKAKRLVGYSNRNDILLVGNCVEKE